MAKCKKCKPTECEECPEWIFTLADLIMCMMGLFVVLWCMKTEGQPAGGNSDDKKATVKTVAAIRDAFGYIPNPSSQDPVDVEMIEQRMKGERVPKGPGEGSQTQEQNDGTEGEEKQVQSIREGKVSSSGTVLMFEASSSGTPKGALALAQQLSLKLRGHKNIVLVKGHTALDDLSDDATDAEKMDLSLARARVVADMLVAQGISREVIRVQGCSTFEPARKRAFGPNSQAPNRRVEIEVTDQLVEDRQDRPKGSPTPARRLTDN